MAAPHNDSQLVEQLTLEEAERRNTSRPEDLSPADQADPERREQLLKPFGYLNERWEELKAQFRPGDELWSFSSSPESWAALAGRSGLVVYRGDEPVWQILMAMN